MKVTKATIHISGTVQPRSFENIKREMTVEVELGVGDDLETVSANIIRRARWVLADSFVGEFQARFKPDHYRHLNSKAELRDYMEGNTIFEAISANAPDIADSLVDEQWEEVEMCQAEEARRRIEREAVMEAQRRERETVMAIAQLAGVEVVANDDPDDDDVPEPDFDTDDEDTAEADYDDFDDEEDETDDLEEEYA